MANSFLHILFWYQLALKPRARINRWLWQVIELTHFPVVIHITGNTPWIYIGCYWSDSWVTRIIPILANAAIPCLLRTENMHKQTSLSIHRHIPSAFEFIKSSSLANFFFNIIVYKFAVPSDPSVPQYFFNRSAMAHLLQTNRYLLMPAKLPTLSLINVPSDWHTSQTPCFLSVFLRITASGFIILTLLANTSLTKAS